MLFLCVTVLILEDMPAACLHVPSNGVRLWVLVLSAPIIVSRNDIRSFILRCSSGNVYRGCERFGNISNGDYRRKLSHQSSAIAGRPTTAASSKSWTAIEGQTQGHIWYALRALPSTCSQMGAIGMNPLLVGLILGTALLFGLRRLKEFIDG